MTFKQPNPFAPSDRPRTTPEMQEAADIARMLLRFDLARKWGLIDCKGRTNRKLCEEILGRAFNEGIQPRDGAR